MARLLDLANELLLGIINVVRVEDLEAFTSCNKRIYGVSEDVLHKHRAMKKKYSRVKLIPLNPDTSEVRSSVHPMVWLHEIILDENSASYPTHLHVHDGIRSDYGNDHRYSSLISDETKNLIYSKLDRCPYIPRQELEWWKEDMESCGKICFEMALALILTSFPNLQSIFTEGLRKLPESIEHMVVQIAKAHQVDKQQPHALSQLTSLHQAGKALGSGVSPSIGLYLPFTGLPSIRSVFGDNTHGPTWDVFGKFQGISKRFKSGITNVNFTQSRISSLEFEELLCRIDALQDFKYEDSGGQLGSLQPGKIVKSLLTHAGHSLCVLDLTGKDRYNVWSDSDDDHWEEPDDSDDYRDDETSLPLDFFMGSLRHFRLLRTVKVDSAMFIEKVFNADTDGRISSKVHRLVDLLPKSIEKLALVTFLGYRPSNHMFDGLVESKADVLPKLEEIKFECFDPVIHDLKQACHGIGIDLVDATTLSRGSSV